MIIQIHDGRVIVRKSYTDYPIYNELLADFMADTDSRYTLKLSNKMVNVMYDSDNNLIVYYDAKHNAHPVEGRAVHPVLDLLIAELGKSDTIIKAAAARKQEKIDAYNASMKKEVDDTTKDKNG